MQNHATNYQDAAQALSRPRQSGLPNAVTRTAKTTLGVSTDLIVYMAAPNVSGQLLRRMLIDMKEMVRGIYALANYLTILNCIIPEIFSVVRQPLANMGFNLTVYDYVYIANPGENTIFPDELTLQDVAFVGALLILFIHKQITDANRVGFIESRVKAIRAVTFSEMPLSADEIYDQEVLANMLPFLQNNFELRRELFRVFISRAAGTDIIANSLRQSVNLMQNNGMTYLVLICGELVAVRHPILHWRTLAEEVKNLKDALDFIQRLPIDERPYVKLLYRQAETAPLHRNRFNKLTAIAHSFARRTSPTYSRLNTSAPNSTEMQTILDFSERVDELFRGSSAGAVPADPLNLGGVTDNVSLLSAAFMNQMVANIDGAQVRRNRLQGAGNGHAVIPPGNQPQNLPQIAGPGPIGANPLDAHPLFQ